MKFAELAALQSTLAGNKLFLAGLLLVVIGLAFKIAAFPVQIWAPDVYQGAPAPTAGFLAVGSKAAGFVLLLRLLFTAVPEVTTQWTQLLIVMSAVTILYGNLCAIPQRNLKRLLGYSSIAHAGYLLLGVAAMAGNVKNSEAGGSAVLFYLSGYLFTILAAFTVITLVLRRIDIDDISGLAGLGQRSPLLAATMTLAMVSLAGIPPLAGFFGKFLLIKAALEQGYFALVAIAIVGVVISIWYYFGIIRAIYWSQDAFDLSPISISPPTAVALLICIVGMLLLGILPGRMVQASKHAVRALHAPESAATARLP